MGSFLSALKRPVVLIFLVADLNFDLNDPSLGSFPAATGFADDEEVAPLSAASALPSLDPLLEPESLELLRLWVV